MKMFHFPLTTSSILEPHKNAVIPWATNVPIYVSQLDQQIGSLYDYLQGKNPNYLIYNDDSYHAYYTNAELEQLGLIHRFSLQVDYHFTKILVKTVYQGILSVPGEVKEVVLDNLGQEGYIDNIALNQFVLVLNQEYADVQEPSFILDSAGNQYQIVDCQFLKKDALLLHASLLPFHKGLLNTYANAYGDYVGLFFGDYQELIDSDLNLTTSSTTPLLLSYKQLYELEHDTTSENQLQFRQGQEASLVISQAKTENEVDSTTSQARTNIDNYLIGRLSSLNSYYTITPFLNNYNQNHQLYFKGDNLAEDHYTNTYYFHIVPIQVAHQETPGPRNIPTIDVMSLHSAIGTLGTPQDIANHKLLLKTGSASNFSYEEIISDDTFATSSVIQKQVGQPIYRINGPSVKNNAAVYFHIF